MKSCDEYNLKNMGKIIKARIGMFALSLKNINNPVQNIRKKPMPDPSKILWAPDLNDIRDKNTLLEISEGCDYICHTAAQAAMTISWEEPELDFSTNTLGTFNVLETMLKMKIQSLLLYSSTNKVYGNLDGEEILEESTRYSLKNLL